MGHRRKYQTLILISLLTFLTFNNGSQMQQNEISYSQEELFFMKIQEKSIDEGVTSIDLYNLLVKSAPYWTNNEKHQYLDFDEDNAEGNLTETEFEWIEELVELNEKLVEEQELSKIEASIGIWDILFIEIAQGNFTLSTKSSGGLGLSDVGYRTACGGGYESPHPTNSHVIDGTRYWVQVDFTNNGMYDMLDTIGDDYIVNTLGYHQTEQLVANSGSGMPGYSIGYDYTLALPKDDFNVNNDCTDGAMRMQAQPYGPTPGNDGYHKGKQSNDDGVTIDPDTPDYPENFWTYWTQGPEPNPEIQTYTWPLLCDESSSSCPSVINWPVHWGAYVYWWHEEYDNNISPPSPNILWPQINIDDLILMNPQQTAPPSGGGGGGGSPFPTPF